MGYYMGDPGFFSIIKSLAGSALGLAPGGGIVKRGLEGAPSSPLLTMPPPGASPSALPARLLMMLKNPGSPI